MTTQPEHPHGICLLRDLLVSWSALGLLTSVDQGQMKTPRMKIVIRGYALNQEALLLNEP